MPSSKTIHKTPPKSHPADVGKPKTWAGPDRPPQKSTKGAGKKKVKKK
jgi:hypothetical protein